MSGKWTRTGLSPVPDPEKRKTIQLSIWAVLVTGPQEDAAVRCRDYVVRRWLRALHGKAGGGGGHYDGHQPLG